MPRLDIRRNYDDTEIAVAQDIDDIIDDIETFTNVTGLDDDNIQDSGITGSTKLVDSSIPAGKLAADSVQTANIQDDAVDKDKIAADVAGSGLGQNANGSLEVNVDDSTIEIATDTLQVKDGGIDTDQLADDAVTTAKIADDAVTGAKLATNFQSGTASTATSASVSITTTGGKVLIVFTANTVGGSSSSITLRRDSTNLRTFNVEGQGGSFVYIDNPSSGTYSYNVTGSSLSTNSNGTIQVVEF